MADVTNTAFVDFTHQGVNYSLPTNSVTATLTPVYFTGTKAQTKTVLNLGDTQTYTITIKNTSGIMMPNVTFRDPLPAGLQFTVGSFSYDGATVTPIVTAGVITYPINQWGVGVTHTFIFSCQAV